MRSAALLPRPLLLAAVLLALALQLVAIHRQSLSGDGAYHLVAGHQALRHGTNTLNLEHPPLVKLVVALPLLGEAPLPPLEVSEALAATEAFYGDPARLRRATLLGRYLHLVFFVLPLLWACYRLGCHFGRRPHIDRDDTGRDAGLLLVAMVGLSLAVLPNLAILQTDAALGAAFALTLLALLRLRARGGQVVDALWVGLAWGLGLAAKHSALLIAPAVVLGVALVTAAPRLGRRLARTAFLLVIVAVAALAVLEAVYALANLRYDREAGRATISAYADNRGTLVVDDRLQPYESALLAVERVDPRLAQWLTGLLGVRAQNEIGVYPAYAFGTVRSAGRWWYFPALLLVKTPLAILLAALVLALVCLGHKRAPPSLGRDAWPAALLAAVYLAAAMASNYNLGVRHLLPITPLLYLPIAVALTRRRWAATALVLALAVESLALMPLWMSATNTWWLGRANPTRFSLGAGNLTYRQSFIVLADETRARGIRELAVVYPPLGAPVVRAYLPDARVMAPDDPVVPGWYAVSVQVEQLVPALLAAPPGTVYGQEALLALARAWLPTWRTIADTGEDHGYVAGTFHLYRVVPDGRGAPASDPSREHEP